MATKIILDDRAYMAPCDFLEGMPLKYEIDKAELEKSIQKNREIVKRVRNNKKYEAILQEVQ